MWTERYLRPGVAQRRLKPMHRSEYFRDVARELDVRQRQETPETTRSAASTAPATLALQRQIGNRATARVLSRLKIGGIEDTPMKIAMRYEDRYGRSNYAKLKTTLTELGTAEFADDAALHTELEKRGFKAAAPAPASTPAPKGPTLEEMRAQGAAKVDAVWKKLDRAAIRGVGRRVYAHLLGERDSDRTADLYWDEAVEKIRAAPKSAIKWQDTDSKTGEDTFVIEYSSRPYRSIVFATKTGDNVSVFHIGPGGK